VAAVATIVVDLLAAIPSIVVGLWGLAVFTPIASGWAEQLNKVLGFIPIFATSTGNFQGTPFTAGWIVAVMIVPIITSVSREIFSQMDRDIINASLALGGTKATSFFRVILPTASGGIVGGVLLGLGRALGETVAIYFVLNLSFDINWGQILENHGGSVASLILSKFGEATQQEIGGLMAAGLVLFIITLLVNWIAAWIVNLAQPWRR
jgi:phosphate transport system permease protein